MTGLLDCDDSTVSNARAIPAQCGKTPHPALFTRTFSFTAQGRSTRAGCWACRRWRQSREPGAGHTATGRRRSLVL